MRLRITRGQPVLNQAAWKFSFTIFSIVKSQKIVNGTGEILLRGESLIYALFGRKFALRVEFALGV